MLPRGDAGGLDPDTRRRVLRSFLLVRIVRGSLLLLFLAAAVVAVELRGWPRAITFALAVALVVQVGALVVRCRRYASTADASRGGSTR